ncbi:hypothetical protein ASD77_12740 [Pseudoxanthomonas sp. Root65]|uniref:sialidase family protein n=1 Tax=Pseudoxanthomonas sp. Root65 TaxID=1736576 RepID=UPI0006FD538B|nr:sialidase family protein [Pseudoxanthomonas sp. Root65]KRA52887.1 hypothetical protein ASD77_12740 [Pseudoxanthomonas sp. Root65]
MPVSCWSRYVVPMLLAVLAACSPAGVPPPDAVASSPVVERVSLPSPAGAAQPDLVSTPDGSLLLSWLEPVGETGHRLRFSRRPAQVADWDAPRTIAEGTKWFVNWADTPHVYALQDGSLWAHWLRSTGPSRMDYGIDLVRSGDGGATWSAPQRVHPAGTPGDHGFVTFWPQARDRLGIAWLDSRQKAAAGAHAHHDDGHHGGGAPMMLRAALYGADATQRAEWPLDASTCDCCTTASAMTDRGVVVVYRGRGEGEIRDTRVVRFDGERWTPPRDVHADGWMIAGCPVNGPVVVADGATVWVAWYTEADGLPELRAARSDDAGDTFAAPVTLAKGTQVLGRLGLARGGDHLLVSWLEQAPDERQTLVLGRYDGAWRQTQRVDVATLSTRGRASGIPRLQWSDDAAWLAWTDVAGETPGLQAARVRFR